ncbi:hypothetical protein JHK86_049758 [Glycine max]|nr:hypothetical protein JHK86_049758 [Glycine max]
MSGDFFQLQLVVNNKDYCSSQGVVYAFEAECWNRSFDLQVELTKVFRQSDYGLTTLLEGIRRGESDPQDLEFLEYLCLGSNGCVNDLLPEI